MNGALSDITVLELANWVAGPSAGAIMADMGANVIKVEPLAGDSMRNTLRQPVRPEGAAKTDYPFHLDNRGKRSLAVDLGSEEGSALVRELALDADVIITNLLPGRLERFGLGYEQLRAANPALVYALVTGYGSTGDDANRIAFDLTAFFGRGGIMSLMGEPGGPPPVFRPGQGDHPTGLALLSGVLAALRVRDKTGQGQMVETALVRTAAWTVACDVAVALVDGEQPNKRARNQAFSPMNTTFETKDGRWIILSTFNQGLWDRFCHAVERPDLIDDPRFATPVDRFRNNEELIGILDQVFATKTADEWKEPMDSTGIIWAKIAEMPDLINDPATLEMQMYPVVHHPEAGTFRTLAAPFTLSSNPLVVQGVGPEVGEHTDQVLNEFGVPADRVASLRNAGVIK